ncbi:mpv17-like protein 2 [Drosophila grimshawi]|uniref:GH15047 n=1 Tax=Drosophila grimshawi TaxID=7222 RepID=B4IZW0_DROGR|nr:mpv17-like protein 2 [Drosophila grimshawi]EDV96732.1 GH15047 [Drosophila grimshawi]
MFVVARRVVVWQRSSRLSTHLPRTFATLTKNRTVLKSDVIGAARRHVHGKGEASNDLGFMPWRWSKQLWGKMFGKYLLLTNVLGSGVLMAVGDFIAQDYEYRRGLKHQDQDRWDGDRLYRMFVAGALQGPLHHFVYSWMDRVMPHRTFRNIVKKILIDQLFMSPACILIFFYTVCYLERQTLQATHQELIAKFPYIYLLDWLTWPAAQYINFRYLDTKYRVAFVNVCTAVYNVLISYMKHDFNVPLSLEPSISKEQLAMAAGKGNENETKNSADKVVKVSAEKTDEPGGEKVTVDLSKD